MMADVGHGAHRVPDLVAEVPVVVQQCAVDVESDQFFPHVDSVCGGQSLSARNACRKLILCEVCSSARRYIRSATRRIP